jgi:hypothetical protein
MRARIRRYRPSADERRQNSDDGKEKNDMAALVKQEHRALSFIQRSGAAICMLS